VNSILVVVTVAFLAVGLNYRRVSRQRRPRRSYLFLPSGQLDQTARHRHFESRTLETRGPEEEYAFDIIHPSRIARPTQ
jgi:hypothetical protein